MTIEELRGTLKDAEPPAGMSSLVEAMWWDAHGDWAHAHSMVDELITREGAWVHAYLHRREGDPANAAYWYRQAGHPVSRDSLEQEWAEIVGVLLDVSRKQ